MPEESCGVRLKRLRQKKHLSQETLAAAANLRKSHISMLESGERKLTLLSALAAVAMAQTLGVSVDYLVTGKERHRRAYVTQGEAP